MNENTRLKEMQRMRDAIQHRDPLIRFVASDYQEKIDLMQKENVELFFKICNKYDLNYVFIHKSEIVGCENKRDASRGSLGGWPAIWAIVKEIGLHGGCGNTDQHQTHDGGLFFPSETYGHWHVKERRKLTDEEISKLKFRYVCAGHEHHN